MGYPTVFLDRDGTLIEHYEYLTDPANVQLLPGVPAALKLLHDRGFKLVMVTNQSGVARGYLTEKRLLEIHDRLKQVLGEHGAYLDAMYYCPYHPEGVVDKYRQDSELRKPQPGMLRLAAEEHDLDLEQSWIIGDDDRDVQTGRAAGCRTVMIESYGRVGVRTGDSRPDHKVHNLKEAANVIVRHARPEGKVSPREPVAVAAPAESAETVEESAPAAPPAALRKEKPKPQRVAPPADPEASDVEQPAHHDPLQTIRDVLHLKPAAGKPQQPEAADELDELSTAETLRQMLRELRQFNREQSYPEFSVPKLLAGLTQMIVLFFIVLAFRYSMAAEPQQLQVQNSLLWAALFQLITLTFLIMHRHK